MSVPIPPGVFDLLPHVPEAPWKEVHLWQYVEKVARQIAQDYGFFEIRTPVFERAELFRRSVGDETDIVAKEMYLFQDRGGRELALRPEGTASVIRALVQAQRFHPLLVQRYFYIAPMFRYERQQAGRFRQHHQFGVEVFGISDPEQDAEIISMLVQFYHRLGLSDIKVALNSLGDLVCRTQFRDTFVQFLSRHVSDLSEDSRRRFEKNPLRIFDSKDPRDQEILKNAPIIIDFLRDEDRIHFERVQEALLDLNISFEISPRLVRGLDYYQRTVFEIISGKLGAQNSIGGGGRFDGLLKQLGGPDLPSLGFGAGIERIIQVLVKEGQSRFIQQQLVNLVIIPLDAYAKKRAFLLAESLRSYSVRVIVDFTNRKVKQSIASAVEAQAEWILVLGERELETDKGMLKYLPDGSSSEVSLSQIDLFAHMVQSRSAQE